MELFRIVSMLLVMGYHWFGWLDFVCAGQYAEGNPLGELAMHIASSACVGCVDMFVLISGWFGIRLRLQKLWQLLFQVWFLSSCAYLLFIAFSGSVSFSPAFIVHIVLCDGYWFVPVYIVLFFLAPAVNGFVARGSRRDVGLVIVALLVLQTVYGWLSPRETGFLEGHSPLSFLILYIVAGYLRRFPCWLSSRHKRQLLLLFLAAVTANALMACAGRWLAFPALGDMAYMYSSPLVIFASVCMLLLFSKINVRQSRLVNSMGASCFAIYLVHAFPFFIDLVYHPLAERLYMSLSVPLFLAATIAVWAAIVAVSFLADRLRIAVFRVVSPTIIRDKGKNIPT